MTPGAPNDDGTHPEKLLAAECFARLLTEQLGATNWAGSLGKWRLTEDSSSGAHTAASFTASKGDGTILEMHSKLTRTTQADALSESVIKTQLHVHEILAEETTNEQVAIVVFFYHGSLTLCSRHCMLAASTRPRLEAGYLHSFKGFWKAS